jgi:multidrug efflux pump subunit AcrB
VEIENIHRQMAKKKTLVRSILDGAEEVAVPAFVSTLSICIVFVPVVFITGAAKSLFVPLAMAVVFAMSMSYLLSRTLVPTLVRKLLQKEADEIAAGHHERPRTLGARFSAAFERGFERLRSVYGGLLGFALARRGLVVASFAAFVLASVGLFTVVGQDFFPSVDAGLLKLHVRGPPGTRLEKSERHFAEIEDTIKSVVPPDQIATLIDNIGIPSSGINLSLSEGALVSPADGEILIAVKPGHRPTEQYRKKIREALNAKFPGTTFFFLAPDISNQVLNFGVAAPIDVQVVGPVGKEADTMAVAERLHRLVSRIPGAVDVHMAQVSASPDIRVDVDRTMADRVGLTERDVASDLLVSLSSSGQTSPSYWLDKRGVQYLVAVQTPQANISTFGDLKTQPLSTGPGEMPQLLSNVATFQRGSGPVNITHYNVARTFDVQANVEDSDLGSVTSAVERTIREMQPTLPKGTRVTLKGQAESMQSSFKGLALGLLFAIGLVYLLMVVNFQSWLDPLIILMALPGALAGIAWMLFLTHTTLSVPALMGAIMCVGVATANSILLVTFANAQRRLGRGAHEAALVAGMTRLRPVIMTALAMIIGMLPMSLGLGEGGEQNAPLGRAVIGGLGLATLTTLFFVPIMYSLLRGRPPVVDPEVQSL